MWSQRMSAGAAAGRTPPRRAAAAASRVGVTLQGTARDRPPASRSAGHRLGTKPAVVAQTAAGSSAGAYEGPAAAAARGGPLARRALHSEPGAKGRGPAAATPAAEAPGAEAGGLAAAAAAAQGPAPGFAPPELFEDYTPSPPGRLAEGRQSSAEGRPSPSEAEVRGEGSAAPAPAAAKKKAKKKRGLVTKPQPFSFTTETRRGRRAKEESEEARRTGEGRSAGAGPKGSGSPPGRRPASPPEAPGPAASTGEVAGRSASRRRGGPVHLEDDMVGGASSSGDPWDPPLTGGASSSSFGMHWPGSSSGINSVFNQHGERQPALARFKKEVAGNPPAGFGHLEGDRPPGWPSDKPAGGSSTSNGRGTRQADRLGPFQPGSKDPLFGQERSQDRGHWARYAEEVPSWEALGLCPVAPAPCLPGSVGRGPRSRRLLLAQQGELLEEGGSSAASSSRSSSARARRQEAESAPAGGAGADGRGRSTSILRGPAHSIRASRAALDDERHVSFVGSGGVEVVQFNVDDHYGQLPNTTRAPRRIFGGELQSHLLASGGAATHPRGLEGMRRALPSEPGIRSVERLPNVRPSVRDLGPSDVSSTV